MLHTDPPVFIPSTQTRQCFLQAFRTSAERREEVAAQIHRPATFERRHQERAAARSHVRFRLVMFFPPAVCASECPSGYFCISGPPCVTVIPCIVSKLRLFTGALLLN